VQDERKPAGNRLASSSSSYLASAANQPVNWYPWSKEAFDEAKRLDKPVLVDVGAVWCHWCHVIDRESYEDEETAEVINQNFVAIKVDRDERPDIDGRLQTAVAAMTGQGGWPLTVFMTPDGRVFFGGTYFPPKDMYGRPGFKSVLQQVADFYKKEKGKVQDYSQKLVSQLRKVDMPEGAHAISRNIVKDEVDGIVANFDVDHGGFGSAPKFPHPCAMELLIRTYYRTRESLQLTVIEKTLTAMGRGGIFDQLAGGFHRYSVDEKWIVPHFEKMLNDNSTLLSDYSQAYRLTGNQFLISIAQQIFNYMKEFWYDPAGGFYASQDADMTLEDDGDYYTWTLDELYDAAKDEAAVLQLYYGVSRVGQMHGNPARNVLHREMDIPKVAEALKLSEDRVKEMLELGWAKLLAARAKRRLPYVDRNIYANWNGLAISGLVDFYRATLDPSALAMAKATVRRVRGVFSEETGVPRCIGNTVKVYGMLDDQVNVAMGMMDLYAVTGDVGLLQTAKQIMDLTIKRFWNEELKIFDDVPHGSEDVEHLGISAPFFMDSSVPSPNSTAMILLDRLARSTGEEHYRLKAEEMMNRWLGYCKGRGLYCARFFLAIDEHLHEPATIAVRGQQDDPRTQALLHTAIRTYSPSSTVVFLGNDSAQIEGLPRALQAALTSASASIPTAYVCLGNACAPPTTDPDMVRQTLSEGVSG